VSTKHAILGLLLERPMHGYQLKRVLSPVLSSGGLVNDGVLYPLLARLERDGLLARRTHESPRRPPRHVFRVTAAGEQEFTGWLASDSGEEDEIRYDFLVGHPFLAKCMFFDRLGAAARRRKLESQRRSAAAKLDELARILAGMEERRVSRFRTSILRLGIAQQEQKVHWLDGLLAVSRRRRSRNHRERP
jgi:DNA-binding PadR family transcriptional regulator